MQSSDIYMIITVVISLLTIISVMVSFFLFLANKIDNMRNDMHESIKDICLKLERIDIEFKSHMIYYHSEKK